MIRHIEDKPWPWTIWSEARQINELNGLPRSPGDDTSPANYFRTLVGGRRHAEAALFLAQAMPRFEAVAWASDPLTAGHLNDGCGSRALAAVIAWLADPHEANRRAAGNTVPPGLRPGAAELCALAVFHSGGSISPEDAEAVAPPRGATGRFAGAAVIAAAMHAKEPQAFLEQALLQGERIASTRMKDRP